MTEMSRRIGETLLKVDNVSLSFGGVKALVEVSFEICEHEILAIIGPNGAGKSSMLNVINGFYHPQEGTITYKGKARQQMRPHEAAKTGIARIALDQLPQAWPILKAGWFFPLPFGALIYGLFGANLRPEEAALYSFEQNLTPRLIGLEEVFAASTLDQ